MWDPEQQNLFDYIKNAVLNNAINGIDLEI